MTTALRSYAGDFGRGPIILRGARFLGIGIFVRCRNTGPGGLRIEAGVFLGRRPECGFDPCADLESVIIETGDLMKCAEVADVSGSQNRAGRIATGALFQEGVGASCASQVASGFLALARSHANHRYSCWRQGFCMRCRWLSSKCSPRGRRLASASCALEIG